MSELKCPKCGSANIKPAVSDIGLAFDYLKDCKDCGNQWSGGGHN